MATQHEQAKTRIGFIGLGHMGSHMVPRLLNAGYAMTLYDRTKEKAQQVAQQRATVVDTPKDLATSCEIVISCVTNDDALEDVMFGSDGALAGGHDGSIYIDMSTVSPHASRKMYNAAQEKGFPMLDAAMSGSVPQVEQGSLVLFVGGDQQIYQQCQPILQVFSKQIFYMGSSGMGTTMKLVVNTLLGLGMQALAEAIALGQKVGLGKEQLLDVLGQTAVVTPGMKGKLENVKREEYPINFALSLMHKDFSLILNEAYEQSVSMPATAAAQQMYSAALATGMDEDISAIIKYMEESAGLKR